MRATHTSTVRIVVAVFQRSCNFRKTKKAAGIAVADPETVERGVTEWSDMVIMPQLGGPGRVWEGDVSPPGRVITSSQF